MRDPMPLRMLRKEPARSAGEDLELYRDSFSWPADRRAALYWAVCGLSAAPRPRRRRGPALAAATCVVAGALAAVLVWPRSPADPAGDSVSLRPAPAVSVAPPARVAPVPDEGEALRSWKRLDLGDLGLVEVSPSASLEIQELETERRLVMGAGVLRAQVVHQDPDRPVVVVTPQLRVRVVGTRFDVRTDPERTRVELFEGAVEVESAFGVVALHAGEAIDSDDVRLRAPAPPPAPAPEAPVRGVARPLRWSLPSRPPASPQVEPLQPPRGGDLGAQAALFREALSREGGPRALEAVRAYQRRFPQGAFSAEILLREVALLRSLGERAEAVDAAVRFEERFASDPRANEVALARATLLCAEPARRNEGLGVLRRLATCGDPEVERASTRMTQRCTGEPHGEGFPPDTPGPASPPDASD